MVAVGHIVYFLLRANFMQRYALNRRVREQTAEIRKLAHSLISIQEQERKRIGQDIHDELGQILTGLRMELDRLQLIGDSGFLEKDRVLEGLNSASRLLDAVHTSINLILSKLRPPELENQSFSAALEVLISRVKNQCPTNISLGCTVEMDWLHSAQSTSLYRIIQESLTNIARHSEASEASIRFDWVEGGLRLQIRDNGKGFDPDLAGRSSRFGILGIKERARWLGGNYKIDSTPGNGTCVTVVLQKDRLMEEGE